MINQTVVLTPSGNGLMASGYYHFINEQFSSNVWSFISKQKLNGQNLMDLIIEYGDAALQDLIRITSNYTGISITEIFQEFNQFYYHWVHQKQYIY